MAKLETPDGQAVEDTAAVTADGPPAREDINREFARAMAAEDPSAVQAPPRRDEAPPAAAPRRRGRPPKNRDEQARAEAAPAGPAQVTTDYTDKCAGLAMLGWATLAAVPVTTPYAAVVDANLDRLVPALNAGCQQNPKIRAAVDRWTSGAGGAYMLQLAAVGTNMAMQTMQLLRDPELRAEARAATEGKFRKFLADQGLHLAEAQPAEAADEPAAA